MNITHYWCEWQEDVNINGQSIGPCGTCLSNEVLGASRIVRAQYFVLFNFTHEEASLQIIFRGCCFCDPKYIFFCLVQRFLHVPPPGGERPPEPGEGGEWIAQRAGGAAAFPAVGTD